MQFNLKSIAFQVHVGGAIASPHDSCRRTDPDDLLLSAIPSATARPA